MKRHLTHLTGCSQLMKALPVLILTLSAISTLASSPSSNQDYNLSEITGEVKGWSTEINDSRLHVICRDGEFISPTKLWRKVMLEFHFTKAASYRIFEDSSLEGVLAAYRKLKSSYVPSIGRWFTVDATEVTLSLFNRTCVGVESGERFSVKLDVRPVHSLYLIVTIGAVSLFISAKNLSKNIMFYYGAGVSIGVIASVLLVLIVIIRMVPGRKQATMVFLMTGFSTFLAALKFFWQEQVLTFVVENQEIVMWYVIVSGTVSFIVIYWYGPPTSPRTTNLLKWFIQGLAGCLLYYSIQIVEITIASVFILLSMEYVYRFSGYIPLSTGSWRRFIPWKRKIEPRKLLTEEEYAAEADEFTRKSLGELREFCKSPNCNAWSTVSRLKSPTRFASFVDGSFHVDDDEMQAYDFGDSEELVAHLTSDEESELEQN